MPPSMNLVVGSYLNLTWDVPVFATATADGAWTLYRGFGINARPLVQEQTHSALDGVQAAARALAERLAVETVKGERVTQIRWHLPGRYLPAENV